MINRPAGDKPGIKQQFGAGNSSGQPASTAAVTLVVVALFAGEANLPSGEAVLVNHGGTTSRVLPMRN